MNNLNEMEKRERGGRKKKKKWIEKSPITARKTIIMETAHSENKGGRGVQGKKVKKI